MCPYNFKFCWIKISKKLVLGLKTLFDVAVRTAKETSYHLNKKRSTKSWKQKQIGVVPVMLLGETVLKNEQVAKDVIKKGSFYQKRQFNTH